MLFPSLIVSTTLSATKSSGFTVSGLSLRITKSASLPGSIVPLLASSKYWMAGQIVMEGFLSVRMRPWLRRLVTRLAAVLPAVITLTLLGNAGAFQLLLISQVVLSLQLPFAVIPLIRFTSDPTRMGPFASAAWLRLLSWTSAFLIVALNLWLAWDELQKLPLPLALLLLAG